MGALVQINAVTGRVKDVPFGVAVSLLNASLGGVTSQKWEITAYSQDIYGNEPDPTNYSGWTLTGKNFSRTQSGTFPAVTFTPDISGNYVVRLTDTTNVDPLLWVVQTAVVRVKDQLSGGYIPAPGENDEADTDRGWALERNQDLRIQSRSFAYGSHMRVVNLTGSTIARGKVAKIIGFTDMHTVGGSAVPAGATVKRERVAKIQLANSNDSDAVGAAYVVVIEPNGILNNGTSYALRNGMFEGVNPSSGATDINFSGFTAGSEIYLSTTGTIVNAPAGSNTVIIGRCVEATSDGDVLFDGSYSRLLSSKYIVQGTSDSRLPNAQFLGSLATGLVKNTTTTGVLSTAAAGTDYEVPLTFSTPGNTRTGNNVTADYITGKTGNQQWYGGFASGDGLTIDANFNATKGPLRLNAARTGFNRAAVSPTIYDFDLTQTFDQTDTTTLDAFYIRGSTVTFNADQNINGSTRVSYVSIGQPTFVNNDDNDILPITDGISTLWIEGAPIMSGGWDESESTFAVFVKSGGTFNGEHFYNNGSIFLGGPPNQVIQKYTTGDLTVVSSGGFLLLGAGGFNAAIRVSNISGGTGISASPGARNQFQVHAQQSVASASVATFPLDAIWFDPSTTTISGTTAITTALGFNYFTVAAPTYNGTVTITAAATVAIGGPPSGTATITQPLSLWVQAGNVRIVSLNGLLKGTTGVVGTAAAGTDYQAPMSAADATINFPTATTIKVGTLTNKFIVQGTTDTMLSGAQFLGALGTGLVKNATTTGVLSIATSGTDYEPALTFNNGLTRVLNTVTNDLFTGKGSAQSVVGATTSGGSLTLSSTSSGTKGPINFGTSSYDENTNTTTLLSNVTNQNVPTLNIVSSSASGVPVIMFKTGSTVLRGGIRGDFTGNMTWYANSGHHYFLTGGDFGTGNVRAKIFNNGNFLVATGGVGSDVSDIGSLFGTSGTSPQINVVTHRAVPATITGAAGSTFNAHWWDSVTQQVNAGTNITTATGYNFAVFNNPTINTTLAITIGATVYIKDAPAVTGGGSMTTPLALWVDAGTSRFDGNVIAGTLNGMLKGVNGTLTVASSTTDYALPTNTFTAGNGLIGGGDLTANRTFDVVGNIDGSIIANANDIQVGVINDTQHGNRGGGLLHTNATTSVAGFMSTGDKSTLANSKFFVGNATNAPASAQNLGTLGTGLAKINVSAGVATFSIGVGGTDFENVLTFSTGLTRATNTITADLSTGIAASQTATGSTTSGNSLTLRSNTSNNGKILFGSSSNGFNESNGQFWIGLASPHGSALVHISKSQNALTELFITNSSSGAAAGSSLILGLDATNDTTKYLASTMLGSSFTTSGLLSAQVGLIETSSTNNASLVVSNIGGGAISFATNASRIERGRVLGTGDWMFFLGGTQFTTSADRSLFEVFTASTLVSNGVSGGIWSSVRVDSITYTAASGSASATTMASLYIVGAPVLGTGMSATNQYSIFCDQGLGRFDGATVSDPVIGGTVVAVWEIPDYEPNVDLFYTKNLIPVKVTGVSGIFYIPLISRSNFGFGQYL